MMLLDSTGAAASRVTDFLSFRRFHSTPRRQVVHLINPLWNATGGSELRTLSLFHELIADGPVRLWTEYTVHPAIAARYAVRRIVTRRLRFPMTGVFVFVGVYTTPRSWIRFARPRRVVVIYNTPDPDLLTDMLQVMRRSVRCPVDVVFASNALARSVGVPGVVHPSPIDVERFTPGVRQLAADAGSSFVVGRMSRDAPEKHHRLDAVFYRRLAVTGIQVRLMGASSLGPLPQVHGSGHIERIPEGSLDPRLFLQDLDCLFYRTAADWDEPFGRVVVEAMATGLPVVCCNRGGFTEVIDHGRNGFLFSDDGEAFEIIQMLRREPLLRRAIGRAARASVEQLYSPSQRRAMASYYRR